MNIKPFPACENITPIAVPVPGLSNLITVNLYALGKNPITLIDTCLKAPGTLEYVSTAVRNAGLNIVDVERIIITHGHMDHFGLASLIRKAAGHPVECFIHVQDQWQISSENFGKEMWSEEASALMAMAGMPLEEKEKVRKRFAAFRELGDPLDDVSVFEDGTEFEGGGIISRSSIHPATRPEAAAFMRVGRKFCSAGTPSSSTSLRIH
jgi:glyoxylase-like metal-dependent hydrolase (beta-lactamase superfamily II)